MTFHFIFVNQQFAGLVAATVLDGHSYECVRYAGRMACNASMVGSGSVVSVFHGAWTI